MISNIASCMRYMYSTCMVRTAKTVTVNLSQKTVDSLVGLSAFTGDTQTEIINKGVQIFHEILLAQSKGGGVRLQPSAGAESRFVRWG